MDEARRIASNIAKLLAATHVSSIRSCALNYSRLLPKRDEPSVLRYRPPISHGIETVVPNKLVQLQLRIFRLGASSWVLAR